MNKMFMLCGALCLAGASLATELVANGGFEQGYFDGSSNPISDTNVMRLLPGSSYLTGWNIIGVGDIAKLKNANNYGITTPFGDYFIDLTGYSNAFPTASLTQNVATVQGKSYVLSFDVGVDNDKSYLGAPVSVNAAIGSLNFTATNDNPNPGNQWKHFSFQFFASQDNALLNFQGTSGVDYVGLDNVSVQSVPEPTTCAVIGLGVIGLLRRRRS